MIKIFVSLVLLVCVAGKFDVKIPCNSDSFCRTLTTGRSVCTDGFCVCKDEVNSECSLPDAMRMTPKTYGLVGRTCQQDVECSLANGFCNSSNMCACKDGFVSSSDNKRCLPAVSGLGSECQDNQQCAHSISYSTCQGGICSCGDAFYKLGDICHKKVGLEENCESDLDCSQTEGASCVASGEIFSNKKLCRCANSMIMSDDKKRCLPSVSRTTEECQDTKQCEIHLGKQSECVDKKCHCMKGFHYDAGSKKCIVNKEFGESCVNDRNGCYRLSKDPNKLDNTLQCSDAGLCECIDLYAPIDNVCIFSGASVVAGVSGMIILATLVMFTIQ